MRDGAVQFTSPLIRGGWQQLLIVPAVTMVAACGAKAPVRPPRAAIAVVVAPVGRASVPYNLDANGVVTPLQTATVVPQVDGVLKDVDFAEGQSVAAGQVLFHIDARPYQAAYDQAVAALARDKATAAYAKLETARYDTLARERSVTEEQQQQEHATAAAAEATVGADQAALDLAKFNLDNTVIKAPISGRTGAILVRAGNVVHSAGASALVVINQVRPILVRFAVPGSTLPMILKYGGRGGLPVTATPTDDTPASGDSNSTRRLDAPVAPHPAAPKVTAGAADLNPDGRGLLSFIDNAVDTTTGTLQLRATFANGGGTLWAGQFVAASVRLFVEDSAIVLPTAAIVTGQTGPYVWVIDSSNKAAERPVVVERASGDLSIISSGVTPGERVVVEGQSRLTDGAPVTIGSGADTVSSGRRGRGGRGGGRGGRGGRGGSGGGGQAPATP